MLSLMRRHAQSWFIKFLLGVIAVVFVFWGVGSYSSSRGSRVALVDGEVVSVADFQSAYRDLMEQARRQFGDYLNEDMIKKLDLKRQALERIISSRLILNEAQRENVIVVDDALKAAIHAERAFQDNGAFSVQLYNRVLAANRLTPADYEESKKHDLTVQMMMNRLALLSLVSKAEAEQFYHWQRDQVKISYVSFVPDSFKDQVKPTEAGLSAFYDQNKEAYRVPEKAAVQYIAFRPTDYLSQVEVDPARAKEFYEITQENFRQPAKVKIKHIFLPLAPGADEETTAKVVAQAEELSRRATQGEDFDALALANSKGSNPDKGGQTDWLTRDQLAEQLATPAFELQIGGVSKPIKSHGGYYIIKVTERQAAKTQGFDEVKDKIIAELKLDKAKELALSKAEEAYGLSAGVTDLKSLADELKHDYKTTELFSRQSPPPGPTADQRFIEAAFSQTKDEVGPVLELPDGYYLVLVRQKAASFIPPLADIKSSVEQDYKRDEAKKLAKAAAEKFAKQAMGHNWLDEAQKAGLEVSLPPAFIRSAQIKDLGYSPELNEAAFELTASKSTPDKVFEVEGRFVAIHFEDRLPAGREAFEKDIDQYRASIRQQRYAALTQAWLKALRERAEVEIDQRFL